VESALKPFRVLAYVVGVMLLVLCVAMVMRYGFGSDGLSKTVAPIHGGLYMLYLVAVMNLGMKARWSWPYMLGVMLGGTVPFLSFYVERRVSDRVTGAGRAAAET
jgi:integral membrane protein